MEKEKIDKKEKLSPPFVVDVYRSHSEYVKNKTSGEGCFLSTMAVAVYDQIKVAEFLEDFNLMQKGLKWFKKNYPNEYSILLD